MPKRLRNIPICIAPNIKGQILNDGTPLIIDELTNQSLSPYNVDDKIKVYEAQVKGWFLEPATKLIKAKKGHNGFAVLMICLSYIEGVGQYRQGESSRNNSKNFFVEGLKRICPYLDGDEHKIEGLYKEARCGLFHNGMVEKRVIINNSFSSSIKFDDDDIKISPSKLLNDIKIDFENYLQQLKENGELRNNFNRMFSNL